MSVFLVLFLFLVFFERKRKKQSWVGGKDLWKGKQDKHILYKIMSIKNLNKKEEGRTLRTEGVSEDVAVRIGKKRDQ